MRYTPMEQLADPARPSAGIGKIIAGLVTLWWLPVGMAATLYSVWYSTMSPTQADALYDELVSGETPFAVSISLATFALSLATLWIVLHVVHNRNLRSLFGPLWPVMRNFVRVSIAAAPLYLLLVFFDDPVTAGLERNLPTGLWLTMLPLSLGLVLLQTGTEELVFRGYLQSQLAATFRSPWIWMGVTSLLFGLLHLGNADTPQAQVGYVLLTGLSGLVWSDLTARTGNIGAAMGLHFTNNVFALLVYSYDDYLYGLSLFVTPLNGVPWMPDYPLELMFALCVWLAARVALRV